MSQCITVPRTFFKQITFLGLMCFGFSVTSTWANNNNVYNAIHSGAWDTPYTWAQVLSGNCGDWGLGYPKWGCEDAVINTGVEVTSSVGVFFGSLTNYGAFTSIIGEYSDGIQYTFALNGSVINHGDFNNYGRLLLQGTFDNGNTFRNNGGVTLSAAGFTNGSTGLVDNKGTFVFDEYSSTHGFINYGTFINEGVLSGYGFVYTKNNGAFYNTASGTIEVRGLEMHDAATFNNDGTVNSSHSMTLSGVSTNSGTINTRSLLVGAQLTNSGTISIGQNFSFQVDTVIVNNGTMNVNCQYGQSLPTVVGNPIKQLGCPIAIDHDQDGLVDSVDTDDDDDGVLDANDTWPFDATESLDTDNDSIGNNADTDDDGDGVPDAFDSTSLGQPMPLNGNYKGSAISDSVAPL